MVRNLFHSCLSQILAPLQMVAVHGILMKDGGGVVHRGHPILASFIGDYPKQVLVTGTKMKDCPKCNISTDKLGNLAEPCEPQDLQAILNALALADSNSQLFQEACNNLHIKPILQPFFAWLPYTNIFQSITPNILHQLLQGIL